MRSRNVSGVKSLDVMVRSSGDGRWWLCELGQRLHRWMEPLKNRNDSQTKKRQRKSGSNLPVLHTTYRWQRLWSCQGVRSEAQSRVTGKILQNTGTHHRPRETHTRTLLKKPYKFARGHDAASYCRVYKHLHSATRNATHDILAPSKRDSKCIVANSAEEAKIRQRYAHATPASVECISPVARLQRQMSASGE